MKVFRPRRLNAAEAEANKARDLQSPARPEQREQHRHQAFRVLRRSQNMVAQPARRPGEEPNPAHGGAGQTPPQGHDEGLSVSGSARRRL